MITIAERMRPFTRKSGSFFCLPGSTLCVQLFPSLVRVFRVTHAEPELLSEVVLGYARVASPVTYLLDLEKGGIVVWGEEAKGYFRYRICAHEEREGVLFFREKGREDWIQEVRGKSAEAVHEKGRVALLYAVAGSEPFSPFSLPAVPRLSLGMHKKQWLDKIAERADMREVFPLWHRLGKLCPGMQKSASGGTFSLLEECQEVIAEGKKTEVASTFFSLFSLGFTETFFPQLEDSLHRGFSLPPLSIEESSSLSLLKESARALETLFFREEEGAFHLLPLLPPQFAAGRLLGISCGSWGEVSLEWSKKRLRRVFVQARKTGTLPLRWPKGMRSFRVREHKQQKGGRLGVEESLEIEEGTCYVLDNMQF